VELYGIYSALVTPMTPDSSLDTAGMVRLLSHARFMALPGVVIAGSTGEGPSLAAVEKRDLVRIACSNHPELKVIIGIATASIVEAVWLAEQSRKAGAIAGLVMPPAYFREADDDAIADWYEELFRRTTLPILIYNFPLRSGRPISPELLYRLSYWDQCIGVKDSSGDPTNLQSFREVIPTGKSLLVGDERLLLRAKEAGWTGSISGASNVLGHWLQTIWDTPVLQGQEKLSLIIPALDTLRKASLPSIAKSILRDMGIVDCAQVRLPLRNHELSESERLSILPFIN